MVDLVTVVFVTQMMHLIIFPRVIKSVDGMELFERKYLMFVIFNGRVNVETFTNFRL